MTYSGREGSAIVVDAASGQPLAGVVVAASWDYVDARTGEFAGVLFMTDAVTDKNGTFVLPPWGPRRPISGNSGRVPRALDYAEPHLHSFKAGFGNSARVQRALDYAEPHLHLFKAGFRYRVVAGSYPGLERLQGMRWPGESTRDSWWDGQKIELEPSIGDLNDYARMLYASMMPLEKCRWVQVPRMAAAYILEARRLKNLVAVIPGQSPEHLLQETCSDADRPLAAYLN
jgi:hypothetical protein